MGYPITERLLQTAENYVNGTVEWVEFHDVLTSDFFCSPCLHPETHFMSREGVARELAKIKGKIQSGDVSVRKRRRDEEK